jgi:hypothetical protein
MPFIQHTNLKDLYSINQPLFKSLFHIKMLFTQIVSILTAVAGFATAMPVDNFNDLDFTSSPQLQGDGYPGLDKREALPAVEDYNKDKWGEYHMRLYRYLAG